MNEGFGIIARSIRHHLMTGLIRRTIGHDPNQNTFVFAEVPDWQLRQWLALVENAASAIEARSGETRQGLDPEGTKARPEGDAQTPSLSQTRGDHS